MKTFKQRVLSTALAMALTLGIASSLPPITAHATSDIQEFDQEFQFPTATCAVIPPDDGDYLIKGRWSTSNAEDAAGTTGKAVISVPQGFTGTVTLENIEIRADEAGASDEVFLSAFNIANGADFSLFLKGTNTLKSGSTRAGIEVGLGATVNIYSTENGVLDTTGGLNGAGIGGAEGLRTGTINIHSSIIRATAGGNAAAIGGGGGVDGSSPTQGMAGNGISISGGTVFANAMSGTGAAIGGGGGGIFLAIEESDNGVGGKGGAGGTIIISGGEVHASSKSGAAIGGGGGGNSSADDSIGGDGGVGNAISINNSEVFATSSYGAGIGGGAGGNSENSEGGNGGDSGDIVISGGVVQASSLGSNDDPSRSAGIGGGGGGSSIGVGVNYGGAAKSIRISGGTVQAISGLGGGAGIGGGKGAVYYSDEDIIEINGENTFVSAACGNSQEAYDISCDNVIISNGSVFAANGKVETPTDGNDANVYSVKVAVKDSTPFASAVNDAIVEIADSHYSTISGNNRNPSTNTAIGDGSVYFWLTTGEKTFSFKKEGMIDTSAKLIVQTNNSNLLNVIMSYPYVAPPVVAPPVVETVAYTSNNSSSNDDKDKKIYNTDKPTIPQLVWTDKNIIKSIMVTADGKKAAYSRGTGETGVRVSTLRSLGTQLFRHDTTVNGVVQVRLNIPSPKDITKDIMVSGYVSGKAVENTNKVFTKWFTNPTRVLALDQQEDFGQEIEIVSNIDLKGIDAKKLQFYSYDKTTNKYVYIKDANYSVDKNGYVHLLTSKAGNIIISEGPLKRK